MYKFFLSDKKATKYYSDVCETPVSSCSGKYISYLYTETCDYLTTFPFDAGSSKIIHFSDVTSLDPASKGNVVGMIRQMTTAF